MIRGTPQPTSRLQFREYTTGDVDFVADLFSDDQARKFYPTMGDESKRRSWIDWNISSYDEHGFGLWVVERLDDGRQIGDCGLTMQDVGGEEMVEVGYHLQEAFRGLGYAIEMAGACVEYALKTLGFESVCSIVDPDNEPSIRVAARVHEDRRHFESRNGNTRLLFVTYQ